MSKPAPQLAPETDESIQGALNALARSAQLARITNDPLLHTLEALAATVQAQHRMLVDGTLTISQAVEVARQPIDQTAILDQLGKSADRIMRIHAVQYLRAGSMRNVLIATAALFAVAAACLVGGYLWGNGALARDQLLAACQSGQVLTAAGGRRYCATWLDPDPGKAH